MRWNKQWEEFCTKNNMWDSSRKALMFSLKYMKESEPTTLEFDISLKFCIVKL